MRNLTATVVAGFLLMAWQTASHTFLNLHAVQEQYSPNHALILETLSEQLPAEGMYLLPGVPPGTSMDDMEKMQQSMAGKPWVVINYQTSCNTNMGGNILRGLGINIVLAFVLVWVFSQMKRAGFGTIFLATLAVGFVSFCFRPYPGFIWYKTPGVRIELLDSLAAFGLAGLWLGWHLSHRKA